MTNKAAFARRDRSRPVGQPRGGAVTTKATPLSPLVRGVKAARPDKDFSNKPPFIEMSPENLIPHSGWVT